MSMQSHPIQPLELDEHNHLRFKKNKIVEFLLETHPNVDMNVLATRDFSVEDRQQFAQLIGYSLSGYGELSYVTDEAYATARYMSEGISEDKALEEKLA